MRFGDCLIPVKAMQILSEEYSSVPQEMHAIANVFGVEQLSQISEDDLLRRLPEVRECVGSDRAVFTCASFL